MEEECTPTDTGTIEIETVIEGEAPESDDEESSIQLSEVQKDGAPVSSPKQKQSAGVIISGEASESEDEVDTVEGSLPPLNVNIAAAGDKTDLTSDEPQSPTYTQQTEMKPKFNSLLNRKLRERNIALRRHLVDTVHQSYTIAARDLHNVTVQLQKTQIGFQDMSSHMQKSTNLLFALEDKVDIVQSCSLLPEIQIPQTPQAASM